MTKKIITGLFIACTALSATALVYRNTGSKKNMPAKNTEAKPARNATLILQSRASAMKQYLRNTGYNQDYCFFIDMGIEPGRKRFFVYNLKTGAIERSGLVAHGSGGGSTFEQPHFSNQVNSNCTSLGKYKVGVSYHGDFGLAFKLHGLDKTNSNAFSRFVVLHAHDCVPESDVYPEAICMSWGCPTVSPAFLSQLSGYITKSSKPVLLEIYNGN